MNLSLNPPLPFAAQNDAVLDRIAGDHLSKRLKISPDQRQELEKDLKRYVERWKEGTASLRQKLQEWNDMLEGVTEEVDFPWPGASSVTMGTAAAFARTFAATLDRNVFDQERVFVAELKNSTSRSQANRLEEAVNWLAKFHSNLVSSLRDSAIPAFRDGTVPIMGEWVRRVEKAIDYRTYSDPVTFTDDYPTAEDAGMDEEEYQEVFAELSQMDASVMVEFEYDEVVYDAPKYTLVPLARHVFYPLSIESLDEAVVYGRGYFESVARAKAKIKLKEYDEEPTREALSCVRADVDDVWGHSREQIEGLVSGDEDDKRLECYKLVLRRDMDGDDIPEKYLVDYEHQSGKILRIQRYGLRRNIDCIVPIRLLKRDGRYLGVSLVGDGYDMFRMIDDFHRHRQNVRAITDCPAFMAPDQLKDHIDLGSEEMVWRPGVTMWLPDQYMNSNMSPRQLVVQNLDNTGNSLDEESGVLRYAEMKLGPSQGMSGQESKVDPNAPATKTLALLQQANIRNEALIKEFKKSIPALVKLNNALYFMYGQPDVKYMAKVSVSGAQTASIEMEAKRELFGLDSLDFNLAASEIALSPEYQMEKAMALMQAAVSNPIIVQMKPQAIIEAWNMFIDAARVPNPDAFKIQMPQMGMGMPGMMPGMPGAGMMPGMPQLDPKALLTAMQGMRGIGAR